MRSPILPATFSVSRRTLLCQLGAAGLLAVVWPIAAWPTPEALQQAIRQRIGRREPQPGGMTLSLPKIAETGNSVPLETGHRRDDRGQLIPRHILLTFTCTYNNKEVFRADWHPAVAANPYLTFYTVATESGRLRFEWIDDNGTVYATEAEITVE